MAKIDDSVKKKVPELRFKGFTDEWHLETLQEQIKDQKRIEEQEKPRKWWELWRK